MYSHVLRTAAFGSLLKKTATACRSVTEVILLGILFFFSLSLSLSHTHTHRNGPGERGERERVGGGGRGVGEREGRRERGRKRVRVVVTSLVFTLQAHVVPRSSWLASRTRDF